MKNTKQRFMVELTKLETLTVSGGGECYWINAEGEVKRGYGDTSPTSCKNNCCGMLGMGECASWMYNGTNYEVPIIILSTGEILQDTQEVRGSC